MMCSDIFFTDDWQYLATLFQDFIMSCAIYKLKMIPEKSEIHQREEKKLKTNLKHMQMLPL